MPSLVGSEMCIRDRSFGDHLTSTRVFIAQMIHIISTVTRTPACIEQAQLQQRSEHAVACDDSSSDPPSYEVLVLMLVSPLLRVAAVFCRCIQHTRRASCVICSAANSIWIDSGKCLFPLSVPQCLNLPRAMRAGFCFFLSCPFTGCKRFVAEMVPGREMSDYRRFEQGFLRGPFDAARRGDADTLRLLRSHG